MYFRSYRSFCIWLNLFLLESLPFQIFSPKLGTSQRMAQRCHSHFFIFCICGPWDIRKSFKLTNMLPSISRNKKRINQIITTNRHHSWTPTAFGSAKKWRQRRVASDNAFSQSLSSTILEKSLRFTLPGWSFCRALHQFKHDPGFHYSWDILAVHFARMFFWFCINLDMIPSI